jgi:hypothetical protein
MRQRLRHPVATFPVGLLALALACGSSGGAGSQGQGETHWPASVHVTLEVARQVRLVVPITGGALTAAGADGTTYALTIPAGALLEDTEIAMTPLAAVSGLPLSGGTLLGVQLEPDGLRLYDFARLLVTPAGTGPRGAQAYAHAGDGSGLHLYPISRGLGSLALDLLHFSGHELILSGDLQAPLLPAAPETFTSADWEARFEHEMQRYLGRERQRALLGQPADPLFAESFQGLQALYYDQIIAPLLPAVATDCASARFNLPKVLGWTRWASIFDGGVALGSRIDTTRAAFESALDACWQAELATCLDPADVGRLTRINTLARQAEMLGGIRYDPSTVPRCTGGWTSTSACTSIGAGVRAEATVAWRPAPEPGTGGLERWVADGPMTMSWLLADCTLTPSIVTLVGEGSLEVDHAVDPPILLGVGGTPVDVVITCKDVDALPMTVVSMWLQTPSLPMYAGVTTFDGSYTDGAVDCTYLLTRN